MGKKSIGTAAKSVTLTYAQLAFLAGKDNASEWVREAIDQAMGVERGELVIIKRLGEDHWSRLIREGIRPAMAETWSKIVRQVFDVAEAHEAAGFSRESFERFVMPSFQISEALRAILRAG